jgi:UDP-glucose 4-epimerase
MNKIGSDLAGKKVFVTGASGFIGSHLAEYLVSIGAEVTALVHYNALGSEGWLEALNEEVRSGIKVVAGDLTDSELISNSITGNELIFHLGALIAIPYSYVAPRSYINTNVIGTLNILEAARKSSARVIQVSTSEVYGTPDILPITEANPLKPQSPYAASKVAADQLALSYYRSFDLPVTVVRPFNTFGPRQSTRAIIPTVLTQMIAGANEIRVGNLKPERDFTYVSDTVEGLIRAAVTSDIDGEVIQLGTGRTVSVGDLIEMCKVLTGSNAQIISEVDRLRPEKSEVEILLSNPSLAAGKLAWSPRVSLEDGLRCTIKWMSENKYESKRAGRYRT